MEKSRQPGTNKGIFPIDDIPPDREDGSSTWVHHALLLTGRLGRIPVSVLLPLWVGLGLLAAWPWAGVRAVACVAYGLFFVSDLLMLALLPVARRSWGPVTPPLVGLAVVRTALLWTAGMIAPTAWSLGITSCLNLILSGLAIYATWVEPFQVQWTDETYGVELWSDGEPVHALHVSDIHFEHLSPRETQLLALVDVHHADLLLLTGDYMNLSSVYDPETQRGVHDLLADLTSRFPAGTYAVTGSPVVDRDTVVPAIFADLPIQWLVDEAVSVRVRDQVLWLMGVRCTYNLERDAQALADLLSAAPAGQPRLLLYHTPDLAPRASELGVDLYLCGHTHGGQIRLPLYGAIATSSRWGKRYEQGRYLEGNTTVYVSRGLGVEGLGAPRARFLAPPEVVSWLLAPEQPGS